MIYVETGSTDVYYNFGLEYYFTTEKDLQDTVFLFWQTTPTLMVGKYQNVLEEINPSYVKEHDITLVRRMSGGGTIYTDPGGFQYTFIQRRDAREITFSEYIAPVIGALKELGIEAAFNGRNDLTIGGRKISGTAQYRTPHSLVHHGSLLFDTNIRRMVESTTVDEYKIISKSIKSVRDRVTNIAEHLPEPLDRREFKQRMVASIMENHGGIGHSYTVTEEDDVRIRALAREKFAGWENIYGKNPRFNIERSGHLPGGKMQFFLQVEHGIVRSASVYGDFFSTLGAEEIASAIVGCRYVYEDIRDALKRNHVDQAIYRITAEDMAGLIVNEQRPAPR